MEKYQKGKIYKLTSPHTDKVYFGSTIMSLNKRLKDHKYHYKYKNVLCMSKELFQLGDVDIELVEKFPCNSKSELLWRERYYIETHDCLNIMTPIISEEERKQRKAEYTLENKKEKSQYDKLKYNKEEAVARALKYKLANSEKLGCRLCKKLVAKYNFARHCKSKKHQDKLER